MEEFLSKIQRSDNQIDFHRRCVHAMDTRTNFFGSFPRRFGKTVTMSTFALAAALSGHVKEVVFYCNQMGQAIKLIKMYAKQGGVSDRLEYDEDNKTFNVLDEGGTRTSTIHLIREGENPCEEPREADVFLIDLALGDPIPKLNTFISFYAARGTPMIGISTIRWQGGKHFEPIQELRRDDDTPLFEIKEYPLACDACTDKSQGAMCKHYKPWSTERKREIVNAIMSSCT